MKFIREVVDEKVMVDNAELFQPIDCTFHRREGKERQPVKYSDCVWAMSER